MNSFDVDIADRYVLLEHIPPIRASCQGLGVTISVSAWNISTYLAQ
jgi:hypothetical protein